MTIRRQMILLIAFPTLVIYIAILGLTMYFTYRESKQSVQSSMMRLADSYASRLDAHLREIAQIAETTAGFMQTVDVIPDEQVYVQLQRDVTQSPFVYGACMAFEPGNIKPAGSLFAPYVCRAGDGFRRVNINESVYDWYRDPRYTWYSRPKSVGHGVWSDPYFDEGAGNILMATYSAVFNSRGKFGGVCTVDIDLPRLQNTVGRDFEQDLDFVILTSDGRFVYDPQSARILSKTIFDIASEQNNPDLTALGRRMLQGASGIGSIGHWDSTESQLVFFSPIRSAKWTFAARFPEKRVLADVRRRTLWSGAALGVTLALIVACIVGVSRLIAAPISNLKSKVQEVGQGNLGVQIDETARADELKHLAASFNRMTSELRSHVTRLAAEQAARQRIEHDLDIAREIQRGLLPTTTPDVRGYEIAGWSLPADKTGGDYYDWETVEDGKTLVSLADVSGHGVGPALVTAVCRAYVRASFAAGRNLPQLVSHLNDLLIADIPEDRFVTFAVAMIDPSRRTVEMISAGHGPIMHYIARDGSVVEHNATDIPLGITAGLSYGPSVPIDLQAGDLLLFITDGFFESARVGDSEPFGIPRLHEALQQMAKDPIEQIIPALYEKVKAFVAGAEQADDMTAVIIRGRPN